MSNPRWRWASRPVGLAIIAMVLAAVAPPMAHAAPSERTGSVRRHRPAGHLVVSSHRIAIDQDVRIGLRRRAPVTVVRVSLTFVAGGATVADGQPHQSTSQADFRA